MFCTMVTREVSPFVARSSIISDHSDSVSFFLIAALLGKILYIQAG